MTTEALLPSLAEDRQAPGAANASTPRVSLAEIAVAVAAFLGFCVVILLKASQLMEPDDYAYRASIVALSQGHIALTTAQYHALSRQVGGISQWVQLPDGRWMSEKNPGYPFFAVVSAMCPWLRATIEAR